jgi:uncharacterized membrane protein
MNWLISAIIVYLLIGVLFFVVLMLWLIYLNWK